MCSQPIDSLFEKRWAEGPPFLCSPPFWKTALALYMLFASFALGACQRHEVAPVTITLLDQGWMTRDFLDKQEELVKQFTQETGIQVKILPSPETSLDQLHFWQKLLSEGRKSPDVYGVDVIWPATLDDYLIDLRPLMERDVVAHFPKLVANYTVNGKLVALPYHANSGVLFYRTDLLKKYGYQKPPRTWAELERMAHRIQAGERASGDNNFWGYVWQGVEAEALTCNALEWQVAEGGGSIIEEDGTISVNNPKAIRAWERAARWVGTISPPAVVAYGESDAYNLWLSGEAAFMRNWTPSYRRSNAPDSPIKGKFELTLLPSDKTGRSGTLGGSGLGVSRFSEHKQEAVELIRFLCRRDIELKWSREFSEPPTLPELYDEPAALGPNPYLSRLKPSFEREISVRPSMVAGRQYPGVSTAYYRAVHSVLMRQKSGTDAARELEEELKHLGFGKGSVSKGASK